MPGDTHAPLSDKAVRHWFATGASGGLGRHLTEHALRNGDRVSAAVRRPTRTGFTSALQYTSSQPALLRNPIGL